MTSGTVLKQVLFGRCICSSVFFYSRKLAQRFSSYFADPDVLLLDETLYVQYFF